MTRKRVLQKNNDGAALPKRRRLVMPILGWSASIAIHLGLAILFLLITLHRPDENEKDRPAPQTPLVQPAEPLQIHDVKPAVELTAETTQLMRFEPEKTAPKSFAVDADSTEMEALYGVSDAADEEMLFSQQGDETTASFCGTVGVGKYVCFIVDHSGSMIMAYEYVRQQLHKSVNRLEPFQYYTIIFYAGSEPETLANGDLLRANAANRQKGLRFADTVGLAKVKNPTQAWQYVSAALDTAFSAQSPNGTTPELIFWLTDGEFPQEQVVTHLEQLQRQRDRMATVSIIACGSQENEPFLRSIAQRYQGQYRFVTDDEMIQQISH